MKWSVNGNLLLYDHPMLISDQFIRKRDGIHLSSIQMAFETGIWKPDIWHSTSFGPFKYPTSLVFRSPLYTQPSMRNLLVPAKECLQTSNKLYIKIHTKKNCKFFILHWINTVGTEQWPFDYQVFAHIYLIYRLICGNPTRLNVCQPCLIKCYKF